MNRYRCFARKRMDSEVCGSVSVRISARFVLNLFKSVLLISFQNRESYTSG